MDSVVGRLNALTPQELMAKPEFAELAAKDTVTIEELTSALQKNMLDNLPKGADVLSKEVGPGGFALSETEPSVVKITNPVTHQSTVLYQPEFSFSRGANGSLEAFDSTNKQSFVIEPAFTKKGATLVFKET